jgi:hypothetical protein
VEGSGFRLFEVLSGIYLKEMIKTNETCIKMATIASSTFFTPHPMI